jgi:hypothetical protein
MENHSITELDRATPIGTLSGIIPNQLNGYGTLSVAIQDFKMVLLTD